MTDTPAPGQSDPMPDTMSDSVPDSMIPRARSASEGGWWRRGIAIAVLSLLLGTITTVLVSWSLFVRYPTLRLPRDSNIIEAGSAGFRWPAPVPEDWPAAADYFDPSAGRGTRSSLYIATSSANAMEAWTLDVVSGGWPMQALQFRTWFWVVNGVGQYYAADPLWVPPRWVFSRFKHAHFFIPLMPIPLGFAVNTALYAVAWLGLILVLLRARHDLRLRAGLCPRCKYPIGPSPVCTECGAKIPRQKLPA